MIDLSNILHVKLVISFDLPYKAGLERLVGLGVIKKSKITLVPVEKPDESLSICLTTKDLKVATPLNKISVPLEQLMTSYQSWQAKVKPLQFL